MQQLLAHARKSERDTAALSEAKQDLERLLEEYERIVKILEKMGQEELALLGEISIWASNYGLLKASARSSSRQFSRVQGWGNH